MQWFHRVIAEKLQLVHERKIKKLMIFMPPQHGKTSASTRTFPGWVLGKKPDTKIAVVSYSATIARRFNRDIKRRMSTQAYRQLFPEILLGDTKNGYTNNNDIVEIVGKDAAKEGFIYTVGVGGSLTSVTVDLGIIDDPIKDRKDALSPTIRENIWGWYCDVFETRLHNDSAQILIQTRWHEDDLGGRLLERDGLYCESNPTGWVVVSFPALRTPDINDFDPRPVGAALWPEKHSQAKIEKVKKDNPVTFNALYQQDPKPSPDSLVFPNWIEIDEWPEHLETQYGIGGDFGFTNDPTTFIRIAREGYKLYLDELVYETGLTNQKILQRYYEKGIPAEIQSIWDKAEPKSIAELKIGTLIETSEGIYSLPGINAKGSDKGPGSVEAGISKLNEFEVYYTARSLNIKREKNHYQYVMHNGVSTNIPIGEHNHTMDAIRGYVFTKWGRPQRVMSGPNND
ncbi:MAG: hypothetical protein BGO59_30990 [Spirosoma sp. 48-14]|nr:MAG: hypothetical protein BGO59_30990 [Spirosoma sp. 48-14]